MAELSQENIILANKIATRMKNLREQKTGPKKMCRDSGKISSVDRSKLKL